MNKNRLIEKKSDKNVICDININVILNEIDIQEIKLISRTIFKTIALIIIVVDKRLRIHLKIFLITFQLKYILF